MEGWVDLVTRKRRRRESNSRPLGPESNALTTEPPSNLLLTNSGVRNLIQNLQPNDAIAAHTCRRDDAAADNGCSYTQRRFRSARDGHA